MDPHDERLVSTLRLLSLDPLAPGFADALAAALSRRVSCPVVASALDLEPPYLADRPQLDADRLLAGLEQQAEPRTVVVGMTARDLAVPIFTYVFGRARAAGQAAVVSTARLEPAFYGLPPDPELTLRRGLSEVLHELGHLAGLRHCQDAACLMRFAGSVEKVDVRGADFCRRCAARLPPWIRGARGVASAQ